MAQANQPATPLRAIDIPASEQGCAVKEWFFNDETMRQHLASLGYYGHEDGSVKNSNGKIIGLWYYVEFISELPSEIFDQEDEITPNHPDHPDYVDQDEFDISEIDAALVAAQLERARTIIGKLLVRIDDYAGRGLHVHGSTPSWYVDAAACACGIRLPTPGGPASGTSPRHHRWCVAHRPNPPIPRCTTLRVPMGNIKMVLMPKFGVHGSC